MTLDVTRGQAPERFNIQVVRRIIAPNHVRVSSIDGRHVLYVQTRFLGADSGRQLARALSWQLGKTNPTEGLKLDETLPASSNADMGNPERDPVLMRAMSMPLNSRARTSPAG